MVDRLFEISETLRFLRADAQVRAAAASAIQMFDVRLSALERAFAEFRTQLAQPS